ncbi:hypothetical protein JTE90_015336 [Oedothorax gibbosus]|uniref:Major facilitator superfamily (MFS) profile domain-containing protein n=1 Tax=Oedothorax gibbosus TaxID=931172 RepID=A0AAV6U666_9ARAC|nr:hypothetical protein JTE90_015336 [Oedothorax gibbosus]
MYTCSGKEVYLLSISRLNLILIIMVDCSCLKNIPYRNVKLHYYYVNAAMACVIPFLPVHAKEIGISAVSLGFIYSFMPLVTMVLKPFFGAVADYFDNLKMLLFIFIGVMMVSSTLTVSVPRKHNMISSEVRCMATGTYLYFKSKPSQDCMMDIVTSKPLQCIMQCSECTAFQDVPSLKKDYTERMCMKKILHRVQTIVHLRKESNSTQLFSVQNMKLDDKNMNTLCFVNLTFTCSSTCEPVLQECYTGKQEPEYSSDQFWLFLIFATMSVSLGGVVSSFSDAICFNELRENGHLYGRQRLWGTIGWGLFSPLAGYLNELVSGDSFLKAYQAGALVQVILLIYDLCIVNRLKTKNLKCSQNIYKDFVKVFCQFKMMAFMLSVLVIGAFTALMWTLLFWHLMDLGGTSGLLGLVSAVQCFLGELVFFFFAGRIISTLGPFNILSLNFICFGVRFIAYSYLRNPWLVLPIELLQGPTYGLFYATMATFAHTSSLPGTEVTVQGMVGSAFEFGMMFGNLFGGMSMQMYGGVFTFFWAGIISFTYCLINILFYVLLRFLVKQRVEAVVAVPVEESSSFM